MWIWSVLKEVMHYSLWYIGQIVLLAKLSYRADNGNSENEHLLADMVADVSCIRSLYPSEEEPY